MKLSNITLITRALIFFSALNSFLICSSKEIEDTRKEQIPISSKHHSFVVGENSFLLDGRPFVVKAAELHYPRIPKDYWDQRIKMCKSLGMNTICLYTFWNVHETEEGNIDFTGANDIAEFVRLCADNDLFVILRPGPYVCAEWEMGGLPWWLLKKKDISLRDNDPYFMERVKIFQTALSQQLKDLTVENGGPIIMIQVENEYGSFGENKEYIGNLRDLLKNLYGDKVLMFQCDWASNFTLNGLDDLIWTMNFGTGTNIDSQFASLKDLRPSTPLMCSEFWSGWFDKWGAAHETRSAEAMIEGIDEMLSKNISFSLYMTYGGTNWGHWAGANSPGYAPDVTSYDYDAPINEFGQPTEKYWLLQKTLSKYSEEPLPELPDLINQIIIPDIKFTEIAKLWDNLPVPVSSPGIKTMEEFNQGYGSLIYRCSLPEVKEGSILCINEPHDYAQIFVNGRFIGKMDRRLGEKELVMPLCNEGDRLDILVEAMGRINFGVAIKDFKGITEDVTLMLQDNQGSIKLNDWEVYLLPDNLDFYQGMNYISMEENSKGKDERYERGVYKGNFSVDKPSDTFLLFETWGKGLVYVNGFPLGRIWEIGPQQTLYTPGCYLKEGDNEILVFDILGPHEFKSEGLAFPVIDKLQGEALQKHRNDNDNISFANLSPVFGGAFPQGDGWQRQIFPKAEEGSYLAIEAINASGNENYLAISEFYVLNEKGERISRELWKIDYVDSEDLESGNNSADKIFDLQESTYWKSEEKSGMPQRIIINLGKIEKIGGIEYLPRTENNNPGKIKDYKIYIGNSPADFRL